MMKVASVLLLLGVTLVSLPTCHGQCASLCADGSMPPAGDATIPVPGIGDVPCSIAAIGISGQDIDEQQCTQAQAAGYLICDCPTVPLPNLNLPCAFCADGTLPGNLDRELEPPIITTVGEGTTCQDLVALASLLMGTPDDEAACEQIVSASEFCGCAPVVDETNGPTAAPTGGDTNGPTTGPTITSAPSMQIESSPAPSMDETPAGTPSPTGMMVSFPPATPEPTFSGATRGSTILVLVGSAVVGILATLF